MAETRGVLVGEVVWVSRREEGGESEFLIASGTNGQRLPSPSAGWRSLTGLLSQAVVVTLGRQLQIQIKASLQDKRQGI